MVQFTVRHRRRGCAESLVVGAHPGTKTSENSFARIGSKPSGFETAHPTDASLKEAGLMFERRSDPRARFSFPNVTHKDAAPPRHISQSISLFFRNRVT